MYRFGWFSTGRDEAARDLLRVVRAAIDRGEIPGEIAFVFCNRERGESAQSDRFLDQVEGYRIPLICFSSAKFKSSPDIPSRCVKTHEWRLAYDREVMRRLRSFHADLCVLAGYMLIVGAEMCRAYDMINLHPATPDGPTGTWQEVIWQLIDRRATETGVMMHLVTPELDRGPVVSYCKFRIRGGPFERYLADWDELPPDSPEKHSENSPLFKLIRRCGLAREFPLIISTLQAFAQGKISIVQGRVVDTDGRPIAGYDLTAEIDRAVGASLTQRG